MIVGGPESSRRESGIGETESVMPEMSSKRLPQKISPQKRERREKPLWFAIIGLSISLSSWSVRTFMYGDILLWFGVSFAVLSVLYWLFQPWRGLK